MYLRHFLVDVLSLQLDKFENLLAGVVRKLLVLLLEASDLMTKFLQTASDHPNSIEHKRQRTSHSAVRSERSFCSRSFSKRILLASSALLVMALLSRVDLALRLLYESLAQKTQAHLSCSCPTSCCCSFLLVRSCAACNVACSHSRAA